MGTNGELVDLAAQFELSNNYPNSLNPIKNITLATFKAANRSVEFILYANCELG